MATENIFETIKAMNSPPPSSEEESSSGASSTVLQNLVACEATDGQSDKNSRRKRSNEGEAFLHKNNYIAFICCKIIALSDRIQFPFFVQKIELCRQFLKEKQNYSEPEIPCIQVAASCSIMEEIRRSSSTEM